MASLCSLYYSSPPHSCVDFFVSQIVFGKNSKVFSFFLISSLSSQRPHPSLCECGLFHQSSGWKEALVQVSPELLWPHSKSVRQHTGITGRRYFHSSARHEVHAPQGQRGCLLTSSTLIPLLSWKAAKRKCTKRPPTTFTTSVATSRDIYGHMHVK